MKRYCCLLIVLAMLLCALPLSPAVLAEDLIDGDYTYVLIDDDTHAEITGYTGSQTDLTLPTTLGGVPVTSVGKSAFSLSDLTALTVPGTITSIAYGAFMSCDDLETVVLGNGVTTLGGSSFYGCAKLADITIPDSVFIIGSNALTSTAWYNSQDAGPVYAGKVLYGYRGLMPLEYELTVEDGTIAVAESALYSQTNLTSVTLPSSVTYIGSMAFFSCTALLTAKMYETVTYIGDFTFFRDSLLSIIAPQKSYAETYAKENQINFIPMASERKLGDVDNNGLVDATDCRLVLIYTITLSKDIIATKEDFIAADYNKDNVISSTDARLILEASLG